MPRAHSPTRRAFTLMELLITISIIIIIAAMILPMMNAWGALTRGGAGTNTIMAAVTAARGYSTRSIADRSTLTASADYSGVAVIFTPANELRLVENYQDAISTDGDPLELTYNGYRDIPDRDYVNLAADVGVVGIAGDSTSSAFLPPPFAVRFDQNGTLITGISTIAADAHRLVMYDGNYDGVYRLPSSTAAAGRDRNLPYGGGTYDLDQWDPTSTQYTASNDTSNNPGINPNAKQHKLPFETMESVVGVVMYSKTAFRGDQGDWPSTAPTIGCGPDKKQSCGSGTTGISTWLRNNGTLLMFNRYTGVIMRENQ